MNRLRFIFPVSNLLNSSPYPNFASGIKVVAADIATTGKERQA
jgi:hypothetical protein